MNEALVTCAIGDKYLQYYNLHFRSSQERFAKKIGRPLVVIEDYIDTSELAIQKHPAWQKLLIFNAPQLKQFNRLCWLDVDIYVTRDSQNPFDFVGQSEWGAVVNNPDNYPKLAKSDLNLYANCPQKNRPNYLLNTGFFVVNRENHQDTLEYVYKSYSEQPCYENGPLSYHLLNTPNGKELPRSFNELTANIRLANYKSIISELRNVITIYKLVKKSNFIHFAGGVNLDLLRTVKRFDKLSIGF